VVACPVWSSEEPAEHVMQVVSGVLQRIDVVDRRAAWRGKIRGLRFIEVSHHPSPGYAGHVIGIYEPQAVVGGDHDPVEEVEIRYFEYVLEMPDDRADGTKDWRVEYGCLIGNCDFVRILGHSRTRLSISCNFATNLPDGNGPPSARATAIAPSSAARRRCGRRIELAEQLGRQILVGPVVDAADLHESLEARFEQLAAMCAYVPAALRAPTRRGDAGSPRGLYAPGRSAVPVVVLVVELGTVQDPGPDSACAVVRSAGSGAVWRVNSEVNNLRDSEERTMTARAEEMVSIPRAELDALLAENRRLRREAGDAEALRRIRSDSGEGRILAREELAEAWGISE